MSDDLKNISRRKRLASSDNLFDRLGNDPNHSFDAKPSDRDLSDPSASNPDSSDSELPTKFKSRLEQHLANSDRNLSGRNLSDTESSDRQPSEPGFASRLQSRLEQHLAKTSAKHSDNLTDNPKTETSNTETPNTKPLETSILETKNRTPKVLENPLEILGRANCSETPNFGDLKCKTSDREISDRETPNLPIRTDNPLAKLNATEPLTTSEITPAPHPTPLPPAPCPPAALPEPRQIQLQGNESLWLDDPETIWQIESGSLAVFAIPGSPDQPNDSRRHLFTVHPGQALFGLFSSDTAAATIPLVAIPLGTVELISVSRLMFQKALMDRDTQAIAHLEGWIAQLASVMAEISPPTLPHQEAGVQYFSLAPEQIFQPRQGITWLQLQSGITHCLAFPALKLVPSERWLPFSPDLWLQAETDVELAALSTTELLEEMIAEDGNLARLVDGLGLLQTYLLQAIALLQVQDQQAEVDRFQERQQLNHQVMEKALGDLASLLRREGDPELQPTALESTQALLMAAGAVGHAIGVTIRPPAKSEDLKRVAEPLDAIARASRVRTRRITLQGTWWKKDCGPLLAYTQDKHPVALLPVGDNRYEIFDPRQRQRLPLTPRRAATLAPSAHMFYRPLPDTPLQTWSLVQFAMQGHAKELLIVLVAGVAMTLLGMITPQATAILIDQAIPDANRRLLVELALGLSATAFGGLLFQLAQGLAIMRVETFADSSTQTAVWDRLLKLKPSFFRQYAIGDLNSRVSSVSQIRQKLSSTVLRTVFSSVFSLLNLGLLFYYSGSLAAIALLVALINIGITIVSGVLMLKKVRPLLELQGQLFGVMVQLINNVTKLRVAGAESRAFAYWGNQYHRQIKLMLSTQGIEDAVTVVNIILPTATTAMLFWFASGLLQQSQAQGANAFSTGTFLAFNAAFGTFVGGATSLSNTVIDLLEVVPLWKRAQPILNAKPEVDDAKADPGRLVGKLTVDHVVFRYRNDGPITLDDVTIHAEPGEFIAFVGASGSGKSTLFRLLLGFDVPESGTIYYDGQDLAGLDVHAVRRQLGVVMQNSRLMSASIFDNIASGVQITMDEAWDAARMAGFAEDIETMPMGMHTVVSEGGTNLSGGQRQRLLIARSLVLKPKILLFDEATSALDNRTQAIVSQSLERLKVTRIAIAHRLSTIRNADRIYVFQSGRIIQQGNFNQLAKQDGLFAQLMARQQI
jgi:NHLM bacteriocin system ABC transporter ATP-binding protein